MEPSSTWQASTTKSSHIGPLAWAIFKKAIDIYFDISAIQDVHMMLLGGFGFLMTFLKRFSFSALGLTFLVVAVVTEWAILLWGFTRISGDFTIHITFME